MTNLIPYKLYLGSLLTSTDEDFLKKANIKSIVRLLNRYTNSEKSEKIGYKYKTYYIDDDFYEDITEILKNIYEDYQTIENPILLHCHAGQSRSVVSSIYILIKEGIFESIEDSIKYIEKKRDIYPNEVFLKQLKKLLEN